MLTWQEKRYRSFIERKNQRVPFKLTSRCDSSFCFALDYIQSILFIKDNGNFSFHGQLKESCSLGKWTVTIGIIIWIPIINISNHYVFISYTFILLPTTQNISGSLIIMCHWTLSTFAVSIITYRTCSISKLEGIRISRSSRLILHDSISNLKITWTIYSPINKLIQSRFKKYELRLSFSLFQQKQWIFKSWYTMNSECMVWYLKIFSHIHMRDFYSHLIPLIHHTTYECMANRCS